MKLMGRLIVLLMGLAAVAFAVKYALNSGGGAETASQASQPKRQLDNVREKSHELERLQQQQADDVAKKAAEQ